MNDDFYIWLDNNRYNPNHPYFMNAARLFMEDYRINVNHIERDDLLELEQCHIQWHKDNRCH